MIPNTATAVQYAGNGAGTLFSFPNKVFAPTDLVVTLIFNATGQAFQQVYATNYTVINVDVDTGCQVQMVVAPPAGYTLDLRTVTSLLQSTSIKNQGAFLPELHEEAFDRVTREIQDSVRLAYTFGIHGPDNESTPWPALPPPAQRAGHSLIFDSVTGLPAVGDPAGGAIVYTQQTLGAILYPQTLRENGLGIDPPNKWYQQGHILRYANLDGTDETTAIQNWASVGGLLVWPVAQNGNVSAEIIFTSNTTVIACKGAQITQSSADLSIFRATNQTNINIRGLHYKQTNWGAAPYVGHVVFDTCTHCSAFENEFEGIQWAGVYIRGSSDCTVQGNWDHDSNPLLNITFSPAPNAGATSGTLTAPWARPTGVYTVAFIETAGGATEGRAVTFTNGSTGTDWSGTPTPPFGALAANCNAVAVVQPATNSGSVVINSSPANESNHNMVVNNFMHSKTLEVGGECLDPYGAFLCKRNTFRGNKINEKLGYGLINYMPVTGDSFNSFDDNDVEDILGSFALNVSTGAGIYSVGAGSGGLTVTGNRIRNCCRVTANATLSPAGIGIAGTSTGTAPQTVTGNSINFMTQYHGILLTGVLGGASVTGNTINQPPSNITGHCITVTNSNAIGLTNNILTQLNTTTSQRGYLIQGIAANCTNITITGGSVTGGHVSCIETASTGGGQVVGLNIVGVTMVSSDSACIALLFSSGSALDVQVTGNFLNTSTCVKQVACNNITYSGNRWKGGGGVVADFSGDNTGSFVDESNLGLLPSGVSNAGSDASSANFRLKVGALPTTGTFRRGDSFLNILPVAAGTHEWVVITGGTSGAYTLRVVANT